MKIDEKWVQEHPKEALDLPVKFGIFLGQKCQYVNNSYYSYLGKTYTTQQLYQYWIENIYKPE